MSAAMSLLENEQSARCLERQVSLWGLFGGTAAEGTVLTKMADSDDTTGKTSRRPADPLRRPDPMKQTTS
ncbi:hypothetical protein I552_9250 [Mycobacterium xenopi 3993]|nr:hypothetical protein I552_9250 [Mycobacterium xenopi 3993]